MAGNEQQGSSPTAYATVEPGPPEPSDGFDGGAPVPTAPGAHTSGRWRLGNWRLRSKLFVVLLVPLVVAALLGALQVVTEINNAKIYNRLQNDSQIAASLSLVVDNLQLEREQVSLFASSHKTAGSGPGSPRTDATDVAIGNFKQLAAGDSADSTAVQAAVTSALNSLSDVDALRSSASSSDYPDVEIVADYSQIIAVLLQATEITESGIPDQTVTTLIGQVNDLRQAKEQFSQSTAYLMITAQNGTFPPLQENALLAAQAQYTASINSFNATASPTDRAMFSATVTGPDVDSAATQLLQVETRSAAGQPLSVAPGDVQAAGDATAALLHQAEQNMYNELTAAISAAASNAIGQAFRVGLLVLLGLVIAFLVALLVARSLVRTLQRLRTGALDMARHRLPASVQRILADPDPIKASEEAVEPVPVFTADEIGEVARSFDVVHGQAVRLAAEQAVLRDNVNAIFVNLARRSQILVERQLSLIDRLERDEQDPDQLANLFELDHLATRMRRNSESLLVLSGGGLAKRMSQPVPIGDLVGAAVSEVEQYARIEVGHPPNAQILGRVVNDLIHLIAELFDNATVFSEPNTKVSVRIAKTRAREVAIQITDRGVGMSEDDVREANERLANPPELDVNVTRRMGLYVVARLAKRHNIRVKLRTNEDIDGGTVALVVIGEDLIHQPGSDLQGSPLGADRALSQGVPDRAPSAPAGAVAAAGIAGAFGMARKSDSPPPVHEPEFSVQDQARQDQENPLDPATAFWSSEFALDELENSGSQPAVPAEALPPLPTRQVPADRQPRNDRPAPQEQPPTQGVPASMLWEAHTAADELPAIGSDSLSDTAVRDRLEDTQVSQRPAAVTGNDRNTQATEPDAPTERLPIYEAVLSQWFRPDEVGGESDSISTGMPAQALGSAPTPASSAPPAPAPAPPEPVQETKATSTNGALPTRVPGRAGAAAGFGITPRQSTSAPVDPFAPSKPESEPVPAAAGPTPGAPAHAAWETPADEGWQLAEALLAPVSETTGAGLPKRVPKAHLVPGSAAARPSSTPQSDAPPLPPRTADAVRGRMSSFQRGVRRGRHALIEAYSGGASPLSDGSHDEEHE
ncbi:MAG TPA: nitrate- and nitrite sensing domain-containing protein [Pseudonocardiaceae bacterium]|nr:nitrate- and nitrite sensing domain-containing protein [Pseudonocardiaceae bacterium]